MISVARAFARLAFQTIAVSRPAAGVYSSVGRWVAGSASSFNILASEQPLKAREVQDLPENRRFSELKKFYTETLLIAGSVDNKTQPDMLTHDSKEYEIISVKIWDGVTPVVYKAIAVLKGQGQ